ncbi:Tyrosine-protein phosphatase [Paramyrothecium foliicola]|nr:Tyrosine-protein phosphatase [Paramyrothecium foliicola]
MPSAAARRLYEDQIPSFMSVFDLDAETMADRDTVTVVEPQLVGIEPHKEPTLSNPSQHHQLHPTGLPAEPGHRHHDSTSTQMSESADSSPTTTMSTTDSSPLSDPSPSSSPDSPINILPMNNFASPSFGLQSSNSLSLGVPDAPVLERPMTSPSPRRPRNMKGLSIQPPMIVSPSSQSLVSEPCSPSFIKPNIPAMKRKPSLLSLKTSSSDLITKRTLEVPPSPGMPPILQRRALKHSTSSPHMLSSLKSSTFAPAGGMTFPKVLERNESGLSEVLRPMKSSMKPTFDITITEESSPIKMQLANRSDEPYHDSGNNEDQKSPGYPQGPIAIYGDNVYLYLEPSAEEASKFDVVINVAREVKNPFNVANAEFRPRELSPIPDSALAGPDFDMALDAHREDEKSVETPTTPKANPMNRPEYIHIPWDHNTDIAPDLMRLCETIDDRTKEGKKVLIHCQQGASRSASLIIAYGLFQKPELSVNDAYYAAQAKSRWISPNMKLMYSLQDFQKEISKKRLPPTSAYRPRTGRSPTKHRLTLSVDAIDLSPQEPHTAPLPGEENFRAKESEDSPQTRLRGNSTPGRPAISPGPASAPMKFSWSEMETTDRPANEHLSPFNPNDLPQRPKTGHSSTNASANRIGEPWNRKPSPPALTLSDTFGLRSLNIEPKPAKVARKEEPVIEANALPQQPMAITNAYPADDALLSPRAEVMTNNPLHDLPGVSGMRFVEIPHISSESLFSPRITNFPRDSYFPFGRPRQVVDPRSPPTKGEAPIIRSIDDLI